MPCLMAFIKASPGCVEWEKAKKKKKKNQKENMSSAGIEPATPRFATWRLRPLGGATAR